MAIVQWNAPIVMRQMNESVLAALQREAARLKQVVQDRISDPYPPASEPMTPPHMRTGALHDSISTSVSRQTALDSPKVSVASSAEYSLYLERGTLGRGQFAAMVAKKKADRAQQSRMNARKAKKAKRARG